MENIYLLLFVCLIFWYFIYLRKVAEFARLHVNKYCEAEKLQYLSIARRSSRLKFNKRLGLHWLSTFEFEFSGDGESMYAGFISLRNYKLDNIDVPAYKFKCWTGKRKSDNVTFSFWLGTSYTSSLLSVYLTLVPSKHSNYSLVQTMNISFFNFLLTHHYV